MAGLLGDLNDPSNLATYQLIGGLLSPGSFGQGLGKGLAAYQGTLANSQEMELKKQQIAQAIQDQQIKNITLQQSQRAFELQTPFMEAAAARLRALYPNGASAPAGGAPDAGQPVPQGGAPGGLGSQPAPMASPPQQQSAGQPPGSILPGVPDNVTFGMAGVPGGMAKLPDLVAKYNEPMSGRPGGYIGSAAGGFTQLPVVPEGFQAVSNGNGGWKMVPVEGGPGALATSSAAKASGKAGYEQTDVVDANGVHYKVFNKDLPGFGAPGASAPSGNPNQIPPAVQAARDQEALKIAQNELLRTPAGPQRDQLVAAIQRIQQGGSPVPDLGGKPVNLSPTGLPPNAIQTSLAPGAVTNAETNARNAQDTMTSSYKNVMAANGSAQTVQARLSNINQLANSAITGGETDYRDAANNLLSLAFPGDLGKQATDRKTAGDLIDKNAAQIALAIGAGSNGTDALRSLAAAANPGRHMTPQAITEAVAQLQGSAQIQQAKASVLTPIFSAGDPQKYVQTEQAFDKNADYRIFQLKNMTPQQGAMFLSRLPASDREDLKAKAAELKKLGAL